MISLLSGIQQGEKMIPSYYDSSRCGKFLIPNLDQAASAGKQYAKDNGIKSSHLPGTPNVILSVIDAQLDFISPEGNLCVPGAVADTDRLNKFIYNNVNKISHIIPSLDTHYLFQPFHRFNWIAGPNPTVHSYGPKKGMLYEPGEHPDAFTLITSNNLDSGVWLPTRNPQRMRNMITKLEQQHKKTLCVWPLHCLLGSPGHAFDPTFMEALIFHAACRNDQYNPPIKGMSQSSEHYGILKAEVEFSDDRLTQLDTSVLSAWENADRIYFAGQAKSHCVLETLNQVVELFTKQSNTTLLDKLYVLEDCMSSVPDIKDDAGNVIVPFDAIANNRFAELKKLGVKFVKSTDSVSI